MAAYRALPPGSHPLPLVAAAEGLQARGGPAGLPCEIFLVDTGCFFFFKRDNGLVKSVRGEALDKWGGGRRAGASCGRLAVLLGMHPKRGK